MQVVSPPDFSGPQPRTSEQGSQQGRRAAPHRHRDPCWLVCGAGRRDLAFLPHVEGVQSKLGIQMLCVPNSSATCSQHSPGPGLWEPGVQHGQSLCDGATVLVLLADEVAVMDEVVQSPENRGGAIGIRDTWRVWGQRCDRNYTCPTSGRRREGKQHGWFPQPPAIPPKCYWI